MDVGDHLAYTCREVKCLDLERECRYNSSPKRQRESVRGEPGSGSKSRQSPRKGRATSVRSSGIDTSSSGKNASVSTAISQKMAVGAILMLQFFSSVPTEGMLSVITGIIVITQMTILSIDLKVYSLPTVYSV